MHACEGSEAVPQMCSSKEVFCRFAAMWKSNSKKVAIAEYLCEGGSASGVFTEKKILYALTLSCRMATKDHTHLNRPAAFA